MSKVKYSVTKKIDGGKFVNRVEEVADFDAVLERIPEHFHNAALNNDYNEYGLSVGDNDNLWLIRKV